MTLILRTILLVSVCIVINTCSDEAIENPSVFSIESSLFETSTWAEGSIIHQNYGGATKYLQVNSAYIKEGNTQGSYVLSLHFTNQDNLQFGFTKRTNDLNYHSTADSVSNKLDFVQFIPDTLQLNSSAVLLQTNSEENTLTAVINIHTTKSGDFNGTVKSIPFVED